MGSEIYKYRSADANLRPAEPTQYDYAFTLSRARGRSLLGGPRAAALNLLGLGLLLRRLPVAPMMEQYLSLM